MDNEEHSSLVALSKSPRDRRVLSTDCIGFAPCGLMFSHPLWRRARLASGLILFTFVTCHLVNLSLGLVSIQSIERWRILLLQPWQSWSGQALLLSAALIHAGLGLVSLGARRSLAMSRADWVQLTLGLATPPLLLNHVVSLQVLSDVEPLFHGDYEFVLAAYWIAAPRLALQQLFVIVIVWVHGAIGLYSALVLKRVWPRIAPAIVTLLFAVPVLALLGFAQAGQEVLDRLSSDPAWHYRFSAGLAILQAHRAWLDSAETAVFYGYAATLGATATFITVRHLRRRSARVEIHYDDGRVAVGRVGQTVLDVSRSHGIPHANVCSGRGRCGTCIIMVYGKGGLDPIGDIEAATLSRVHAKSDARLACQAHLLGLPLAVSRVYPVFADPALARRETDMAALLGDGRASAS